MTLTEHLERARSLARRKGHLRVTAVHLLVSLSNAPDVQRRMADAGLSLARLDRFVRDGLVAEPDARGYRDAPEPPLDLALEPLLATTVMELALFEALIAPLVAELRFDATPIQRFVEETGKAASASGHERALVEHALYALARRATDDGRFADALSRLGHNRRDFRHRIAERITVVERSGPVPSFEELLHRATLHANTLLREVLVLDPIVVDLLRGSRARRALQAVGVPAPALLFSYVHGGIPPKIPQNVEHAELVFYADDFTPPPALADLLVRYFGTAPGAARDFAEAVRAEGRQSMRPTDSRGAAEAVKAILRECADLGLPLRVELRPISGFFSGFE